MTRFYGDTETGEKLVSVTSVLPHPQWADQSAMERGTRVHKAVELMETVGLNRMSIRASDDPFVAAYEKLKGETKWKPKAVELVVGSPKLGYAGKVDQVGTMQRAVAIVDIKTGDGSVDPYWGIQLAGYEIAWREQTGAAWNKKVRRFVFQLRSDGNYRIYPMEDPADATIFVAHLNIWKWKLRYGLEVEKR